MLRADINFHGEQAESRLESSPFSSNSKAQDARICGFCHRDVPLIQFLAAVTLPVRSEITEYRLLPRRQR
jgi:hypothetical protein